MFVVGKDGRIKWSKTYDIPQQPDNEELLAALDSLEPLNRALLNLERRFDEE